MLFTTNEIDKSLFWREYTNTCKHEMGNGCNCIFECYQGAGDVNIVLVVCTSSAVTTK